MIKSLSRTHKGLTIAILSLIAALNYRYTSNTITLVDDESYYDDPDHNNNNHNNDYGNINVNRANLNFLTRTNHQDLLVDLVDRPMNPHDDNSLTRRLAHNTRGLEHLDPNSAKYKRILKRREGFRIARKEERVRRRVQLRTLKRMMTDVHLRRGERTLDQIPDTPFEDEEIQDQDLTPQTICSRPTDLGTARDFNLLQQYSKRAKCPGTGPESDTKSILLIEGTKTFGRTGNNLIEFLHALQYSRDHDVPLGVMSGSWAMRVLLKMWMAIQENNEEQWIDRFERAFCVKILKDEEELEFLGYENVIRMETRDLFVYKTQTSLNDYLGFQGDNLRTLWNEYNTGEGTDGVGKDVNDMCSGIDAVFGNDRETAIYSVIHSRSLEGEPGFKLLRNVSRKSGCDPVGALEMTPDYIKSILSPLGMLNYPIVFITDGQNSEVLERLQNDPDIGPQLRLVPEEASWVGGDITLAIMSNVFIGNPASTFSGFIAKSRLAMGFGHNYLFRAKNDQGGWMTICGDDCIFDRSIMASMY